MNKDFWTRVTELFKTMNPWSHSIAATYLNKNAQTNKEMRFEEQTSWISFPVAYLVMHPFNSFSRAEHPWRNRN